VHRGCSVRQPSDLSREGARARDGAQRGELQEEGPRSVDIPRRKRRLQPPAICARSRQLWLKRARQREGQQYPMVGWRGSFVFLLRQIRLDCWRLRTTRDRGG
jgi:hypothetical protein